MKNHRQSESILNLWQQYSAYKMWNGKGVEKSYRLMENKLKSLSDSSDPQTVVDELRMIVSVKGFLTSLKDLTVCCEWAVKQRLITVNPFGWLKYQLSPIYSDMHYLRNANKSPSELTCIYWQDMLPKPTGQEIAKVRISQDVGVCEDYASTYIQPSWFIYGEAPVLLMVHKNGYIATRKVALSTSELAKGTIRQVLFDEDYVAALSQQGRTWYPPHKGEAVMEVSDLTAIATGVRMAA